MKTIPVSGGHAALVSDEDYDTLVQFKWMHNGAGYAFRWLPRNGSKTKTSILMHVHLLGFRKGFEIDHINSNGLDNRRENLRFVDHGTNMQRTQSTWSQSGLRGVRKCRDKWQARLKQKHLGVFTTAFEAALAYDVAAMRVYGEHARVNFLYGTAA